MASLLNRGWYIVTTFSSHENKVAENIKRRIVSCKVEDCIFDVIVAEVKEITETKDGKVKEKMKNLFPGFIFVDMITTDEAWYVVRNTPGVTGIIGSSGRGTKPTPVPLSDMENVFKMIGQVKDEMLDKYNIGDKVRIISGPFQGLEGELVKIDRELKRVVVQTIFYGKPTDTETDFTTIEKI